jgi:hypothetical protein
MIPSEDRFNSVLPLSAHSLKPDDPPGVQLEHCIEDPLLVKHQRAAKLRNPFHERVQGLFTARRRSL